MIENNSGGVVVFDLSERIENKPIEYTLTAQYIEKLVKNT